MKNPISHLKEALKHYKADNPAFTQRQLASKLKISPGYLSDILASKRCIPEAYAPVLENWLAEMGMPFEDFAKAAEIQRHAFFDKCTWEEAVDRFQFLSQPEHDVLLSLQRTKNHNPEPDAVAKLLKLPQAQVDSALLRLKKLGLLAPGRKIDQIPSFTNEEAVREKMLKILSYAKDCQTKVRIEDRNVSGVVFACDEKKLRTARALISQFTERVAKMCAAVEGEDVYTFSFQLFPLARKSDKT